MKDPKLKQVAEKTLASCKQLFAQIDAVDKEILTFQGTPSQETLLKWARVASGAGNFILKKYKKFEALVKNLKSSQYMKIKLNTPEKQFRDGAAKEEASYFVSDLRLTRDILLSYVTSSQNILSICRMHQEAFKTNINFNHNL